MADILKNFVRSILDQPYWTLRSLFKVIASLKSIHSKLISLQSEHFSTSCLKESLQKKRVFTAV